MTRCYAQVKLDGAWRTVDDRGMVSIWRTSFNVCQSQAEAQQRLDHFYPGMTHKIVESVLTLV